MVYEVEIKYVAYLSRAKNQTPDTFFTIRVHILVLDEALKSGPLLIKTWVAFHIIKLRKIGSTVFMTKQVFGRHHDERLTEVPVYLESKVIMEHVNSRKFEFFSNLLTNSPDASEHGSSWQEL